TVTTATATTTNIMYCVMIAVALLGLSNGFLIPERPEFTKREIATVPSIDAPKYMGRWYQMYTNTFGETFNGKDQHCVMADYKLMNATTLSVFNSGKLGSPTGDWRQIEGSATQISPAEPGKFQLYLEYVPFPGTYWVIKLGPIKNDQYQYSVVTSSDGSQLYVLTRDVSEFNLYEKEILDFVAEKGFTEDATKPIFTPHEANCPYVDKKQPNILDDLIKEIMG
ncbi:unnamed protein product, partial [Owenia fusiformis]